jgi:hypothetical protein
MNKQQLQNLVEAYINCAVEETSNGSFIWSGGEVEDFLCHNLTEEEMQTIQDLLYADDRIAEADVYAEDGKVTIDCMFWLDACEQTCRHAVLFRNTRTGEEYYLQHVGLSGDEQDEDTDADLIEQAELLDKAGYYLIDLKEGFEFKKTDNVFGIRQIIKTIEMQ